MKKIFKYAFVIIFVILGLLFTVKTDAFAQTCASTRVINQFACLDIPGQCTAYADECSNDLSISCRANGQKDCDAVPGSGNCLHICTVVSGHIEGCGTTGSQTVSCDTSTCSGNVNIQQ